jgi:hypothetical protein
VHQVGPGDDRGHDEDFGTEKQPGAVERVDRCDHGLSRLYQQFVAASA